MKKILSYLMMILVVSSIQACKKDENKHPEIATLEIKANEPTKALFKGNIISKGSYDIKDHGFIYSQNSYFDETNGTKISLGKVVKEGEFSTESAIYFNNFSFNHSIYAKAYITNDKGTAYGEVKSATLPVSNFSNIIPSNGKAGDIIEIMGQFFVTNPSQVKVTFGNVSSRIIEVTNNKIKVEVPTGINTQSYYSNLVSVQIYINNSQISSNYTFTINPIIKDFNPKTGYAGTVISISGENFNSNSNVRVFFDEIEVYASINYSNEIRVNVPSNISAEKCKISVLINGVRTTLNNDFTLLAPSITSINPIQSVPGTSITVNGTGLPAYSSTGNSLLLGNTSANMTLSNSNTLYFTAPNGIAEGEYTVKLKSGPFNIEAPVKFKVVYPSIQSFTPTSGSVGEEITLTGTFYPNTSYSVNFGNANAVIKSIASNMLVVYVPSVSTPGDVKISIVSGGKTNTSANDFKIVGAAISSFSPRSGIAGEVITIKGTGFNTYSNTVRFGSINAQILSSTATEIKAIVPSNLLPAEMKITVIANGQTIVSTDNFTSK